MPVLAGVARGHGGFPALQEAPTQAAPAANRTSRSDLPMRPKWPENRRLSMTSETVAPFGDLQRTFLACRKAFLRCWLKIFTPRRGLLISKASQPIRSGRYVAASRPTRRYCKIEVDGATRVGADTTLPHPVHAGLPPHPEAA